MDQSPRLSLHLPLPMAAALVYREVTGKSIEATPEPLRREVLCDVAHALSVLAPLYVMDGSPAEARELLPILLIGATFEQGASVIRLQNGQEQRHAVIRRPDMEAAVLILKECGFKNRWGMSVTPTPQRPSGAT